MIYIHIYIYMLIQVDSDELVAKPTAATFFHHPKPFGFSKGFHLNERKSTSGVSHHHTRCIASHPVFQGESQLNNESTTAWSSATTRNHVQHYGNSPFLKESQPKNGSRKKNNGSENGKRCGKKNSKDLMCPSNKRLGSKSSNQVKEHRWYLGLDMKKKRESFWGWKRFKKNGGLDIVSNLRRWSRSWHMKPAKNRLKLVALWAQSSISVRKKTFWLCSGCANFFRVSESKIRGSLGHRWMSRQKWRQVTPRFTIELQLLVFLLWLHPQKLTWALKMMVSNRNLLFQLSNLQVPS